MQKGKEQVYSQKNVKVDKIAFISTSRYKDTKIFECIDINEMYNNK